MRQMGALLASCQAIASMQDRLLSPESVFTEQLQGI
ncbi:Uncharacterised protein [Bordetella pertussis]|nr:Uncharacterised protein [Bordetella pertussis]